MEMGSKPMQMIYVVMLMILNAVTAVEYNETNEGYAQTFMPTCPGIDKPADIKPEHLNKIRLAVFSGDPYPFAFSRWTYYNYHNVKSMVMNPNIDFRKRTIIYTPGYLEATHAAAGRFLLTLYRQWGYNVLMFELIEFTSNIFPIVARLMRPVGRHAAEMLVKLTAVGLDPKKLEIVGISLGGLSMTFIAKSFKQITGTKMSKLIALDPTGPCVRHLGPEGRLDPSDADLVIHMATNTGGYGITTPVGHVSIYVNGGEYQPGFVPMFMCDNVCSHVQTFFIWVSALSNPGKFLMMKCDSVQQAKDHKCFERKPMESIAMDIHTDGSKPGIYYLATKPTWPYYLGKKGLKRSGAEILNHLIELNAVDVLRV